MRKRLGEFLKRKTGKPKKEKEPSYYRSATNVYTLNYRVYYMTKKERIAYFLSAFVVGAVIGYVFYGGLGRNEFGEPTTVTYIANSVIITITGAVAGALFLPVRTDQIKSKRKKELMMQFRDLLESLATSIGSGKNVPDAFLGAYEDLSIQYPDDAYILKELEIITIGLQNNISIEEMLEDFGQRSGVEDVLNFANVFKTTYRKGGNMKDVIRNTHEIISEKLEIELEIRTLVTSAKMEQNIMAVMPVFIVGAIKLMSPEFAANYATAPGIVSTTIGVVMFIAAYFIGKRILAIKI